ncbi:putative MFS transporter [Fusarium oxysporum f. sp. albedinis]|nr:putative MFS transporter [Fusarium oxysporum f. sp. albedinis]
MPRDYLLPFLSVCLFVIQLGLSHVHRIDSPGLLPEEKCRDEPVQQRLNFIMMGMQISATISATLVAFPLGVLSDRIGRLPVLGASILSMILSQSYAMFVRWKSDMIPLEAIWCIGVALLFGGGRSVAEAMWVVASGLVAQLEGPVLSEELVQSSVWMPLFLSLGLVLGGGIILVSLTPETLKLKQPREDASIGPYDYGLESNMLSLESLKRTSVMVAFKSMFSRPLLRLIPGTVMTIPLATVQTDIAIRLMPIQFSGPLNRSILIVSLRSLVTLLTLCILLPVISSCASSLLFLAGCLCMMMVTKEAFIVAGLAVSALGSGLPTLCRSMLLRMTGEERAGMLFGLLAVCEILGLLACEASMGALFGVGLKTWLGMPFCLGTAASLVISLTTWLVPTKLLNTGDG